MENMKIFSVLTLRGRDNMKKITFYSACMVNDKKTKVKRQGYYIKTDENEFGIFKNEYNDFDIIDLRTGLSINYLNYYKLKDFKNDIKLFDDKLNEYKERLKCSYNKHVEDFKKMEIEEEGEC